MARPHPKGRAIIIEMLKTFGGQAMGGDWFVTAKSSLSEEFLTNLVQRELDAVNTSMSPWLIDSELNLISKAPVDAPILLSHSMTEVLSCALALEYESGGALSPTLGRGIGNTGLGFAGRQSGKGSIELNGRYLQKTGPIELDLCAVAKGYAVDCAAQALQNAGIFNFLINAAGDMYTSGAPSETTQWRVALELPVPNKQVILRQVTAEGAIATSGTYRKQAENCGEGHLIDGRNGQTINHGLISVSVRHETAMLADGWATALAVLGPEDGMRLAYERSLPAIFISQIDTGFKEQVTGVW